MNDHPWRETADEKPRRLIHDNDRPDEDAVLDGKAARQSQLADDTADTEDAAPMTAQPISREAAERGIAPDNDPDDPVSP